MLWNTLKKLSLKEIAGLIRLSFRYPVYVLPTLSATRRCIAVCDRMFGKTHHRLNLANAFRHALWNTLIASACYRWRKNLQQAIQWTRLVTDWHEEFSVNTPLERAMDLHNNEVGRTLFLKNWQKTDAELVTSLKELMANAMKFRSEDELQKHRGQLVYISD